MIGVRGVRRLVVASLTDRVAPKVEELRTREGLPAKSFPKPARVIPHEPGKLGLDRLPVLAVLPVTTDTERGPVRTLTDGLGDTYTYRYRLWIYGFVTSTDTIAADTQRDLLALATREVLLQHRALTDAVVIDPNTIVESYSEIDQAENRALIAGFRFTVEYIAQEHLAAPQTPGGPAQPTVGIGVTP